MYNYCAVLSVLVLCVWNCDAANVLSAEYQINHLDILSSKMTAGLVNITLDDEVYMANTIDCAPSNGCDPDRVPVSGCPPCDFTHTNGRCGQMPPGCENLCIDEGLCTVGVGILGPVEPWVDITANSSVTLNITQAKPGYIRYFHDKPCDGFKVRLEWKQFYAAGITSWVRPPVFSEYAIRPQQSLLDIGHANEASFCPIDSDLEIFQLGTLFITVFTMGATEVTVYLESAPIATTIPTQSDVIIAAHNKSIEDFPDYTPISDGVVVETHVRGAEFNDVLHKYVFIIDKCSVVSVKVITEEPMMYDADLYASFNPLADMRIGIEPEFQYIRLGDDFFTISFCPDEGQLTKSFYIAVSLVSQSSAWYRLSVTTTAPKFLVDMSKSYPSTVYITIIGAFTLSVQNENQTKYISCPNYKHNCHGFYGIYPSYRPDALWPYPYFIRNDLPFDLNGMVWIDFLQPFKPKTLQAIATFSYESAGIAQNPIDMADFVRSTIKFSPILVDRDWMPITDSKPLTKAEPVCDYNNYNDLRKLIDYVTGLIQNASNDVTIRSYRYYLDRALQFNAWSNCQDLVLNFVEIEEKENLVPTKNCIEAKGTEEWDMDPCCNPTAQWHQCCVERLKPETQYLYSGVVHNDKIEAQCKSPSCTSGLAQDYAQVYANIDQCTSAGDIYNSGKAEVFSLLRNCSDYFLFTPVFCTDDVECQNQDPNSICDLVTNKCAFSTEYADMNFIKCIVDNMRGALKFQLKVELQVNSNITDEAFAVILHNRASFNSCTPDYPGYEGDGLPDIDLRSHCQFGDFCPYYPSCEVLKCQDRTCDIPPLTEQCDGFCSRYWNCYNGASESNCADEKYCNWKECEVDSREYGCTLACGGGIVNATLTYMFFGDINIIQQNYTAFLTGFSLLAMVNISNIIFNAVPLIDGVFALEVIYVGQEESNVLFTDNSFNISYIALSDAYTHQLFADNFLQIVRVFSYNDAWPADPTDLYCGVCVNSLSCPEVPLLNTQTCDDVRDTTCVLPGGTITTVNSAEECTNTGACIPNCVGCTTQSTCESSGVCSDSQYFPTTTGACVKPIRDDYTVYRHFCSIREIPSPIGCIATTLNQSTCEQNGYEWYVPATTKEECEMRKGCFEVVTYNTINNVVDFPRVFTPKDEANCTICHPDNQWKSYFVWKPSNWVRGKLLQPSMMQKLVKDRTKWENSLDHYRIRTILDFVVTKLTTTAYQLEAICRYNKLQTLLTNVVCDCSPSGIENGTCYDESATTLDSAIVTCVGEDQFMEFSTSTATIIVPPHAVSFDCAEVFIYYVNSQIFKGTPPIRMAAFFAPFAEQQDFGAKNLDGGTFGQVIGDGIVIDSNHNGIVKNVELCVDINIDNVLRSDFVTFDFADSDEIFSYLIPRELSTFTKNGKLCVVTDINYGETILLPIKRVNNWRNVGAEFFSATTYQLLITLGVFYLLIAAFAFVQLIATIIVKIKNRDKTIQISMIITFCLFVYPIIRAIYFFLVPSGILSENGSIAEYILIVFPTLPYFTAFSCVPLFWAMLTDESVKLSQRGNKKRLYSIIGAINAVLYLVFIIIVIVFDATKEINTTTCLGKTSSTIILTPAQVAMSIVYSTLIAVVCLVIAVGFIYYGRKIVRATSSKNVEVNRKGNNVKKTYRTACVCAVGFGLNCVFILITIAGRVNDVGFSFAGLLISEIAPTAFMLATFGTFDVLKKLFESKSNPKKNNTPSTQK